MYKRFIEHRVEEACGGKFAFGIVLYDNTEVVPFGEKLAAAPLSCLRR